MKFFRKKKTEGTPVTPYRHWPYNIAMFYPEIHKRDRDLPAAHAFERQYPDVVKAFPENAWIGQLMDYIEENKVEPQ